MAQIAIGRFIGNGYVINNPIFIDFIFIPENSNEVLSFFTLQVTDASTMENESINISPIPGQNRATIDISDLIKSFFPKPEHDTNYSTVSFVDNNRRAFNFLFIANYIVSGSGFSVLATMNNRVFFRAGYDNNKKENQYLTPNTVLRRTELLPYWTGYPVAEYYIDGDRKIVKNPIIGTIANKERRTVFNCDNYYVKFLNSMGGYSYWLFQGMTVNKTTTNLGYSNVFNDFHDFGNKTKRTISLYSKVPARFYPLMEDLVESREIYIYNFEGITWQPIKNENNKTERNDNKKNYEVRLNFELISGYNPSGWSR